jgi:hypothetical protein
MRDFHQLRKSIARLVPAVLGLAIVLYVIERIAAGI